MRPTANISGTERIRPRFEVHTDSQKSSRPGTSSPSMMPYSSVKQTEAWSSHFFNTINRGDRRIQPLTPAIGGDRRGSSQQSAGDPRGNRRL